jgi:hypothetical protein
VVEALPPAEAEGDFRGEGGGGHNSVTECRQSRGRGGSY